MSARPFLLRRILLREDGVTLSETLVAGLVSSVLVAMMISWFGAITAIEERQDDASAALDSLREARALIGRELRAADQVITAQPERVTVWVDSDRDGTRDSGEVITWSIGVDGDLVRSDDGGAVELVASSLVVGSSGFAYDATDPSSVSTIGFDFVVVTGPDRGERRIGSEIAIRAKKLEDG